MNYFIRGGAANADKIKAAFEAKGFNTLGINFENKTLLYFSFEGCIKHCSDDWFFTHLIKTHPDYKELELPVEPKFKVGDWVVSPNGSQYLIAYIDKEDNRYLFEINEYTGEPMHYEDVQVVDGQYHLWKIADAKDGDVLVSGTDNPFIYDGNIEFSSAGAYVGVSRDGRIRLDFFPSKAWTSIKDVKPSTKEQRDLLFAKMKEAGYQWDADKKELKKIKPHYDISNFKPKQWVLVRDDDEWEWALTRFSYLSNGSASLFVCINGASFQQCIPFNDKTKHLLGTTDMPSREYINW